MKKASIKKRVVIHRNNPHAHDESSKEDFRENSGMLCPDCREPMTEVVTHAFKWECRCLPGIHFCE
jgi:hypothetical protein